MQEQSWAHHLFQTEQHPGTEGDQVADRSSQKTMGHLPATPVSKPETWSFCNAQTPRPYKNKCKAFLLELKKLNLYLKLYLQNMQI